MHGLVGKEVAPGARQLAGLRVPVTPSRIAAARFALPASRVLSLGNALRGTALAPVPCQEWSVVRFLQVISGGGRASLYL